LPGQVIDQAESAAIDREGGDRWAEVVLHSADHTFDATLRGSGRRRQAAACDSGAVNTDVASRAALPHRGHGLTPFRRRLGLFVAALALPAMTGALATARGDLNLGSVLLLYLLAVVVISVIGGLVGGVAAATGSFVLANFFLTPPYHTFTVESRDSLIALLVFLVVAVTVSVLVDLAARQEAAAARSEAEATLLGRVAAEPITESSVEDVLGNVATTFGLESVILVERHNGSDTVLARGGTGVRRSGHGHHGRRRRPAAAR
jgi:K+-sensing histidine kinase KdpD